MPSVVTMRCNSSSRYSVATLCLARKGCRRFLGKFAALSWMALALTVTASGQTLVVTSGGVTVSQGDTKSITAVPSMPNLQLSVNGGSSCDSVSYAVSVSYTDRAGQQTSATYVADNEPGDQAVTVSWSGVLEGGGATVSWQFNGVNQSSTLGFFITGTNPPNSIVDTYALSGPWFIRNLISRESSYRQYDDFGYPLWGTPDGIGLLQLEPPNRISLDQDYWSWPANIADGLQLLSRIKIGSGPGFNPYDNWTAEFNDMGANTAGGRPVPANWPSDCLPGAATGAVCAGFGSIPPVYCSFSSSNPNGSPNGFGDANWIHAYNGSYFVTWVDGLNGNTGHWEYDALGPFNGYVYNVCTSAPL